MNRPISRATLLAVALLAQSASAHWCHDLWGSSYNIVVKPATDTVNVPSGGSATLDVFVQNNMGYPLKNFALRAAATGYSVTISRQAPKVTGYLMPGENLQHTLTLTGTTGTFLVEALSFYVNFGDGSQDQLYGGGSTGADHAVLRRTDGTRFPNPLTVPTPNDQALHLAASAKADFQSLSGGLDDLMGEFCSGRGSWDSAGGAPTTSFCTGTATTCPAQVTRGHTKYDYQHLWASFELAYRKSALSTRTAPLRARLVCAQNDTSPSFHFFPYAMLGYLGEDTSARAFFRDRIDGGTPDEKAAAKAGLLLFGNTADSTAYHADVTAALDGGNQYVQMLAATTLGIVDGDDGPVNMKLIPQSGWVEPDTSDDGLNFFAAHLLNLVAWNRRGWAADAAYSGNVSFYSGGYTTAPRPPASVACSALANGTVRVTWNAVTQDVLGGAETVTAYRVYSGLTSRPGGATVPGQLGFDYDHLDTAAGLFFSYSALGGTAPSFFTVVAVDAAGNSSVYAQQVSCTPIYPPVAQVNCTPGSGLAPLTVTCDSAASTDPNGSADIVTRAWALDGAAQPNGATFGTTFNTPGTHVVRLTLTDAAGLTASATASISANSATNQAPVPVAAGTPLSGSVPLTVAFSSAGTSDPDAAQTLSYSWDFGDGTAASTQPNPSHNFTTVGTWDVLLTVTDNGTPAASGVATVRVVTVGNSPPDISTASATPAVGPAPHAVRFDATGAIDPEGNTMSFRWVFGDGTPDGVTQLENHTYPTPGTYTARLEVRDNGQPALPAPATMTFTINVTVPGAVNHPPDCSAATVTPSRGAVPLAIVLDATGCVDPDGDPLTLTWRVPRSITTEDTFTDARVTTTMLEPGTHTITLHARDAAPAPLEIDRTFTVAVGEAGGDVILGGCPGCGASSSLSALALFGVAVLWRGRRRQAR